MVGRGTALTGDRKDSHFQNYLKSIGIDKKEILDKASEMSETFKEEVVNRGIALELHRNHVEMAKAWYTDNNKKMLGLIAQLQMLETDMAVRRKKMKEEDAEYDPLADKVLQSAERRKTEIVKLIQQNEREVTKINMDADKREGAKGVTAVDIDWSETE